MCGRGLRGGLFSVCLAPAEDRKEHPQRARDDAIFVSRLLKPVPTGLVLLKPRVLGIAGLLQPGIDRMEHLRDHFEFGLGFRFGFELGLSWGTSRIPKCSSGLLLSEQWSCGAKRTSKYRTPSA